MGKYKDLSGIRFGKLIALNPTKSDKNGHMIWECICDCGNTTYVRAKDLSNGNTKSCGCLKVVATATHGMCYDRDYERWKSMKKRCNNPNNKDYKRYGGRGINVCDEWMNDFSKYREYIHSLPDYGKDGYTIDRIDNSKGYEPGNLRWATAIEQTHNRG